LFVASMSGHCDVVKCLLRFCAEINLFNEDRQSPLLQTVVIVLVCYVN
jgi:ankyrin repeat protein